MADRIEADVLMSRESSTIKAPMMGTAENLGMLFLLHVVFISLRTSDRRECFSLLLNAF